MKSLDVRWRAGATACKVPRVFLRARGNSSAVELVRSAIDVLLQSVQKQCVPQPSCSAAAGPWHSDREKRRVARRYCGSSASLTL
jgi:hypothetical protein